MWRLRYKGSNCLHPHKSIRVYGTSVSPVSASSSADQSQGNSVHFREEKSHGRKATWWRRRTGEEGLRELRRCVSCREQQRGDEKVKTTGDGRKKAEESRRRNREGSQGAIRWSFYRLRGNVPGEGKEPDKRQNESQVGGTTGPFQGYWPSSVQVNTARRPHKTSRQTPAKQRRASIAPKERKSDYFIVY